MASNLNDYYASKGQALPTVDQRQASATAAGITGYTGTADQNATLLGYLDKTPNQGQDNTVVADNLDQPKPILPPPVPTTSSSTTGIQTDIGSLLTKTQASADADQATYDKQTADLAAAMKASGDTSAFDNTAIANQGVDDKKKLVDSLSTSIAQEQKSALDQVANLKSTFQGTTAGLQEETNKINTDSANRLANYGIALSAATNDYNTASTIANRLITQNSDALKADVTAKQFVLSQLGTKLGTEQANAMNLQLKAIDNTSSLIQSAVTTATEGAKDGSIDGTTAFQAVADLTSGKISLSDFYTKLGVQGGQDGTNVGGSDITNWNPTDPTYEGTILGIYNNIGDLSTPEAADAAIKQLSPSSPITGQMLLDAAKEYNVDPKTMLAMLVQESSVGTSNVTKNNNNQSGITRSQALQDANPGMTMGTARPTGEGGNYAKFPTLQDGIDFQAKWLSQHPASTASKYVIGRNPTADAWVANIESGKAKLSDITGNPNLKSIVSQGLAASGADPSTILNTTVQSLNELNDMVTKDNGFKTAVGVPNILTHPLNFAESIFTGHQGAQLPGSSAEDFVTKFNQVKNDVILPNLSLLHGLGRITDREFQALSSAITSLSTNTSETQFKSDLKDLTDNIQDVLNEAGTAYNGIQLNTGTSTSTPAYNGIPLPH